MFVLCAGHRQSAEMELQAHAARLVISKSSLPCRDAPRRACCTDIDRGSIQKSSPALWWCSFRSWKEHTLSICTLFVRCRRMPKKQRGTEVRAKSYAQQWRHWDPNLAPRLRGIRFPGGDGFWECSQLFYGVEAKARKTVVVGDIITESGDIIHSFILSQQVPQVWFRGVQGVLTESITNSSAGLFPGLLHVLDRARDLPALNDPGNLVLGF
ncbi:hypothetical protein B0H63DRAFT_290232 [Podospora didyma]|uniref:Uncharacterized protein n=1 Tax=Podospora didyma TaxID=330526 RepID=A0AAE0N685_9PEZI|nr:hypothetical protein B0H63DRAFT_290232 [Podospora didyma]